MKKFFILFLLLLLWLCSLSVKADVSYDWHYEKPSFTTHLLNVPRDYYDFTTKYALNKEYLPEIALVTASTIALWYYDEKLYKSSHDWSEKHINHDVTDRKKTAVTILGFPVHVPHNFFTGLYFIGDGLTEIVINSTFYAYGFIGAPDLRAQHTAMQITEGLIGMTALTQGMKYATGRESPNRATEYRGKWTPFPGPKRYGKAQQNYNAYPSGHVANLLTTVTIIAENYPEYEFVRPIGYTATGLLAYSMTALGVHWASDYPLAIALGIGFGKIISARGKKRLDRALGKTARLSSEERALIQDIDITPIAGPDGALGAGLKITF